MGAADVVPGVSGGTIAFISGIYEELINSLRSIDHKAVITLKKEGLLPFWKHINGNFLCVLFTGIAISVISLARGIKFLLDNYPVLIWAFFFGLILGSSVFVAKKISRWSVKSVISLLLGIVAAYYITIISPAETSTAGWFIFLSGMIAICAMILPGISGSFILLLLGKYEFIIEALNDLKIKIIVIFAAGCVAGLLSFSHILSWMFKKYHDITIAVLTGFMLGSLNKIWPWKETLTWRENSHGELVPLQQKSIFPSDYPDENYLFMAVCLAITGFFLIFLLEKLALKK